jgi:hypothetical protein
MCQGGVAATRDRRGGCWEGAGGVLGRCWEGAGNELMRLVRPYERVSVRTYGCTDGAPVRCHVAGLAGSAARRSVQPHTDRGLGPGSGRGRSRACSRGAAGPRRLQVSRAVPHSTSLRLFTRCLRCVFLSSGCAQQSLVAKRGCWGDVHPGVRAVCLRKAALSARAPARLARPGCVGPACKGRVGWVHCAPRLHHVCAPFAVRRALQGGAPRAGHCARRRQSRGRVRRARCRQQRRAGRRRCRPRQRRRGRGGGSAAGRRGGRGVGRAAGPCLAHARVPAAVEHGGAGGERALRFTSKAGGAGGRM